MAAGRWKSARRRLVALSVAVTAVLSGGGTAWAADDVRGSDVSGWQHPSGVALDWTKVRGAGESFTFVKATEGVGFVSKSFSADWQASRAAGLVRGAYHFARPAVGTAVAQADYFVAIVGGFSSPGDLPPVLDLEVNGGLTPAQLAVWTGQWLTEVRARSGRTPIVYTSPNFWATSMNNSKAFVSYPLWVARYGSAPSALVWPRWTFWQYTQVGTVPGVVGAIDRNLFNGSLDELRAMANLPAAGGTVDNGTVDGSTAPTSGLTPVASPPAVSPPAAFPPAAFLPAAGRLTGAILGVPGVSARADGTLATVARTSTGVVWAEFTGGRWSAQHALAGRLGSDPRIVASAGGRLDVFARSTAGALLQRTRGTNGRWGAWRSLGGHLAGTPSVTSPSAGALVVAVRGTDRRLWVRRYAGGRWGAFTRTGSVLTGDPAVATAGAQATLVARTSGSKLATATLSGTKTSRWTPLAGSASGAPTLAARGNRLTLVVRDSRGVLHRRVRTAGRWGGWQVVRGPAGSGAAVAGLVGGDALFTNASGLRYARLS